jgi:hypothetical protein
MLSFYILVYVGGDLKDRSGLFSKAVVPWIILREYCVSLNVIRLVAGHSVLHKCLLPFVTKTCK